MSDILQALLAYRLIGFLPFMGLALLLCSLCCVLFSMVN